SYFYKKDIDGITHVLGYNDQQFLNTRARLLTSFQDTPSGNIQNVILDRPFYSLTTRTAAGISLDHSISTQKIYQSTQLINQYDLDHFDVNPFMGLWVNNDPLNVVRTQLSYRYAEDIYHSQTLTAPGTVPSNKALSGPILSTTLTQSGYIKDTFIDKTGRVEDINLGHQSYAGIGYVDRALGATENSLPIAVNDSM